MNAIDLLEKQHREVEELFEDFDDAGDGARKTKERLCRDVSDQLAVHAEIEEKLFYPESKQEDTEEILRESVEEHLAMKRLLAEIMEGGDRRRAVHGPHGGTKGAGGAPRRRRGEG